MGAFQYNSNFSNFQSSSGHGIVNLSKQNGNHYHPLGGARNETLTGILGGGYHLNSDGNMTSNDSHSMMFHSDAKREDTEDTYVRLASIAENPATTGTAGGGAGAHNVGPASSVERRGNSSQ